MQPDSPKLHATPLFGHTDAGADMFFSEVGQFVVCCNDAPGKGFRLWVQAADGGTVLAVGLRQDSWNTR
jgi:hypothetical protein